MIHLIILTIIACPMLGSDQDGSSFESLFGKIAQRLPHEPTQTLDQDSYQQPSDETIYEGLVEDMTKQHTQKTALFCFTENDTLKAVRALPYCQKVIDIFLTKLSTLDSPTVWSTTTPNTFPLCKTPISQSLLLNIPASDLAHLTPCDHNLRDRFLNIMQPLINKAKNALAEKICLKDIDELMYLLNSESHDISPQKSIFVRQKANGLFHVLAIEKNISECSQIMYQIVCQDVDDDGTVIQQS